jgi:cytochrome c oxidase subunit 2
LKRPLVFGAIFLAIFTPLIVLAGCGSSNTQEYSSNGQRIYFTSTSDSGDRITYTGGPGGMMQGPLACVTCHGREGHGGTVQFMMESYNVPNITWPELTGPDPDMEHPPYTEETLKRAITQGLDPGGGELEYPMPRWQMSAQDLNDLVGFIKTLK